jgi:uncharacterized linocin/CFP29 family protein
MEILNRTNAPFSSGVWSTIDETMREYLSKRLAMRGLVDFEDQYSYDTDAIFTKELKTLSNQKGLSISTREPIKMLEIKKTFTLSNDTIEQIKRGVEDFEDKELASAANEFATIENTMILEGLKQADFQGIANHKDVKKVEVKSTKAILQGVAQSLGTFNKEFVEGDFKLVLSSATMAKLYTEFFDGISVKTKLDDILGENQLVINEDMGNDKAMIISQRGGDFEFCSGLDISVGFEKTNKDNVELFLLQTCALRILGPEAAIIFNLQ